MRAGPAARAVVRHNTPSPAARALARVAPARVALAGAAFAAGAAAAGAQAVRGPAVPVAVPPALAAEDARLAGALAPDARARLAEHFSAAAGAGVPVEPLVAKALEGVELGAPPERIDAAVRALLGRLTVARAALAPVVSDAELVSGADALAAGVPAATLRRVRAASPGRSAAVALGVLAQLVARGVPVARAADAVTGLLRRGARPAQLAALDEAVRIDVAAGVPATVALDTRVRTLAGALLLPPGAPGGGATNAASAPTPAPPGSTPPPGGAIPTTPPNTNPHP